MKVSDRKNSTLSDIRFMFRPKSINFNRPKANTYRLYLQKNVQVINQIDDTIRVNPKNPVHIFNSDLILPTFRVINEKQSTYQLVLYQVFQNGQEIVFDSAQFSLNKFLEVYYRQFLAIQEQLKGKQKSTIAQEWRTLSNNFSRKVFFSAVKFKIADALLEFTCTALTDYDQLVKEDNAIRQKRKNSEIKNRKGSQLFKAKTLPTVTIQGHIESKRYHQNESSRISEVKNRQFDQKTKKEVTQSLKKFSIKIPDIRKSQQVTPSSNSNQIISALSGKSKLDIQEPMQKIQQGEQGRDPSGKAISTSTKKNRLPQIYIRNLRQLQIPQTNGLNMKVGNLSLNSVMYTQRQRQKKIQYKNNTKQIILTSVWISAYIFIIVLLMHPISKVQ